jgi:hypothetical protein
VTEPFRDPGRAVVCPGCSKPNDEIALKEKEGKLSAVDYFHQACWNNHYESVRKMVFKAIKRDVEEKKMGCATCEGWADRVTAVIRNTLLWMTLVAVIGSVFTFGMICLWNYATASNKVTWCYVETEGPLFNLFGNKDWRGDASLGKYGDLANAIKASEAMGCKIQPILNAPTPETPQ